ncbi:MAG: GNAT family N-acetyltransferase [Actinomycetota bacterium]
MTVTLVGVLGDREPYLGLLLEADDSEEVVRSYMDQGLLFEIRDDDLPVGEVLVFRGDDEIEIKSIAVDEAHRGRGIGPAAIAEVVRRARGERVARVVVGTADCAPDTIAFYRRCGFRDAGRREGFFDAYPAPVMVAGVQAHDMVMLEMRLGDPWSTHRPLTGNG